MFYFYACCVSNAQQYNFRGAFNIESGLPSNHIYSVIEDSDGFLWVGTDNGISRFDGTRFVNYSTKNGLPSNDVIQVTKDNDGIIWANCYRQPPSYFDEKQNRFVSFENNTTVMKYSYNLLYPTVCNDGVTFRCKDGKLIFKSVKFIAFQNNIDYSLDVNNKDIILKILPYKILKPGSTWEFYDGKKHLSLSSYPELRERSFIVASFGKLFHNTGWKVGYCLAPLKLMTEFRKIHQYVVFSVNTPTQYAIADMLSDKDYYSSLSNFFEEKRNFFRNLLQQTRFQLLPCEGSYFQCVSIKNITSEKDLDFAKQLTIHNKVAAIPTSAFYSKSTDFGILRFCFAKKQETLEKSVERLAHV